MPPDLLLPLVFGALVTLYFLVRWITIRLAEADLQKPLGEALDRLIKQVKYHEVTPLQDLRVVHMGAHPGVDDPNDTSTHYEIYPSCSHYFVIAHIGVGEKRWYRVDRWREDLSTPSFPPWSGKCRSPWFVERMQTLCALLDAYPREKLLSPVPHHIESDDPDSAPLPAA